MISHIYQTLFVEPLKKIYLYGPSWNQVGFWAGKSVSQICAQITNHPDQFWAQHIIECDNMIDNKFASFLYTTESVLQLWCLYYSIKLSIESIKYVVHLITRQRANSPEELYFHALKMSRGQAL